MITNKLLAVLILITPFYSISKVLELTDIAVTSPYIGGVYFLQFDEDIADSFSIADSGFAMGSTNIGFIFNNTIETTFGYNYTHVRDYLDPTTNILILRPKLKAHIFYLESGFTAFASKQVNLSLLLGTEKIFISREGKKLAVPEGLYLRPLMRLWSKNVLIKNNTSARFGIFIDYKMSLNERLLDNQLTIGLTAGS